MGLTQEQMADRADSSRPAINQIEKGRGMNSVDTLARILAAYGLNWSFLDYECEHVFETRCRICDLEAMSPAGGTA